MRTIIPEILAPAGAREQLEAAVRSGADAVYFGAGSFNARRNAENFSGDSFPAAVDYCHERGVKAYITLNTLVKDTELEALYDTLELIAQSGADAVIVQDPAVAETVRGCCPTLPLHASTQMAVHNAAGAVFLRDLGFKRIVLARELSITEIREICRKADTEIEVFVHGAHCMSASGMCYLSSVLGARSGNRGLCAQPCRLDFKAEGREYALSLKDMCLAGRLGELTEAGVTSFKIEGRMKRPEYVAAAVTAYRRAARGESYDLEALKNVFSRSGFTDGYAAGKRDLSMFGYRTKDDVAASQSALAGLHALYKDEYKRVPLTVSFTARENENALLAVSDGVHTVTAAGSVPEKALKMPLTEELAAKNLLKLGGTFYRAETLTSDIGPDLMLTASSLNAMRREACEKLTALRGERRPHPFARPADVFPEPHRPAVPELRLRFRRVSDVPENVRCDMLILPCSGITEKIAEKYGGILCAELPALIYPSEEEAAAKTLSSLAGMGVKKALCNNVGAIPPVLAAGLEPIGGPLLNVLNSKSLAVLSSLGVKDVTVSPEISFDLFAKLSSDVKTGLIAYGHLPLMHFRCCPMQGKDGCGACTGERFLTDRRGEKFRVLCEKRKYSVLYNPVPLYVGDKTVPAADHLTLYFTDETKEQAAQVTETFINGKSLAQRRTAGLYDKKLL